LLLADWLLLHLTPDSLLVGIEHNDMQRGTKDRRERLENGFLIQCDRRRKLIEVDFNFVIILLAVILSAFRRQQAATDESMLIPTLATA
jgi:hypothetical protein